MTKDVDNKNRKAVQKVLGEPFGLEFSDKVWKIRTNLLILSIISLFVSLARLSIEPGSTVFGLRFAGMTDEVVTNGLFWITLYFAIHFLWSSFDGFTEWRLRVTGTKLSFVTTGRLSSHHGDYPNDPRQSTLYSWWTGEAKKIGAIKGKIDLIDIELERWEKRISEQMCEIHKNCLNISNASNSISVVRDRITELTRAIEATRSTLETERIPASLERFDRWFKLLLRSQNIRWCIFDFMLPVILSIAALIALKVG